VVEPHRRRAELKHAITAHLWVAWTPPSQRIDHNGHDGHDDEWLEKPEGAMMALNILEWIQPMASRVNDLALKGEACP